MSKIIRNVFGEKLGFDMIDYPSEKEKCHKLFLGRIKTLSRGNECCDFI